jgi:hypothetical protein
METVIHCDTPKVSDHCDPEDTSSDQSEVKPHELDSGARKNCDDSPQGNEGDEQLDLFITDTILPLMRSRLSEDCESSPRYVISTTESLCCC